MALAEELDIPESGAVFTFGKSHFADNEPSHFFIKNDPVVQLACGDQHTAVICEQGRVFAFGDNSSGQLGLGPAVGGVGSPVTRPACLKWLKPRRAALLAAGQKHTIILTDNDQLYGCGCNASGQLGIGSQESQPLPQYIQLPEEAKGVKAIAAGAEHTVILSESGSVYGCGSNTNGQLGLGPESLGCLSFQKLPLGETVTHIACGHHHSMFITESGGLLWCGSPGWGSRSPVPRLLEDVPPVSSCTAGARHVLLQRADTGAWLALGDGARGQLGLGSTTTYTETPQSIGEDAFKGEKVVHAAAGKEHSAFLTESGLLYMCGALCPVGADSVNGNLEQDVSVPALVQLLQGYRVLGAACGGHHTVITARRTLTHKQGLPPLKIPPSMNQMEAAQDNINMNIVNQVENLEKISMDSLDANVSGSHIININELTNTSNGENLHISTADIMKVGEENPEQMITIVRQETVIEIIQKPVEEVIQEVESIADDVKENVKDMVDQGTTEINEATVTEVDLLKVPETLQHSPNMSTKSEVSQKTVKSTSSSQKSENETIICHSDKSSPLATKAAKTQAVIPIQRSEEMQELVGGTQQAVQEAVQMQEKKTSRFFSGSCMRGDTTVPDSTTLKEAALEGDIIGDQTNSRTCSIL